MILTNRQVAAIVKLKPASATGLLRVSGVGEGKVASYGDEIVGVLARQSDPEAASEARQEGGAVG